MARQASYWDAFRDPRLALMIGLGFSSGLPNPLAGDTLSAWFDDIGVGIAALTFFVGWAHLPYSLKFIWAPLFDRFSLPFLSRRRGWMVVSQVGLLVGIGVMGSFDPASQSWLVTILAMGVAFMGASQDIVVDAYRTELLPEAQRASGVAVFVAAYRVALIVSGALVLVLADHFPWTYVFWFLAGLMSIGIVFTLVGPPPDAQPPPPRTLRDAVIEPFREFMKRDQAWLLLAIVMLYKFGDVVVGTIRTPFLRSVGFTLTEIGVAGKFVGISATILGALIAGGFVAKWGLKRALIVFGIGQAVPNLTYALLGVVGKSYPLMIAGYGIDNFMGGMGTAAQVAFFMTIVNKRFTATQYALLTSLMTVPGRLFGMGSGVIAEAAGWPTMWILSVVFALPALLLLTKVRIVEPES